MTESENRVRTRNTVRLVVALIVAAMIVIAQLPPINRWSGHNYLIWGAIAVVAVDYLRLAVRRRNPIYAALLVYTVAVLVGAIAEEAVDPPRAVMIGVAVGSVAAGVVALALVARQGMRRKELDRFIFSEASSLAFFATMLSLVTSAFLHDWLQVAVPHPYAFVGIGAGSYIIATIALRRRFN